MVQCDSFNAGIGRFRTFPDGETPVIYYSLTFIVSVIYYFLTFIVAGECWLNGL